MVRKYILSTSCIALILSPLGCGREDSGYSVSPSASTEVYDYSASSELAADAEMPAAEEPAAEAPVGMPPAGLGIGPGQGGDRFDHIVENAFLAVADKPRSTFSIDVDTASYSKTRVYLMQHQTLPPPDAVRIEELVNYFHYDYSPPTGEHPFAVHVETAGCPWQAKHRLVRVGIKGKELKEERPASNLVFLMDVSGSMNAPNKLPLVKRGLRMLVNRLGENDRVAIAVYAGAAGLVLPPTSAVERDKILTALDRLHAGGSTNGGEGIELAYGVALENYITGGTNRVILCTDGDFNVGVTSTGNLVRLAERHAKAGVFLSVLGFGIGNHNDAMLEEISNKANGNYAFIDTPLEANKVLVEQLSGTLVTIAKDVKIQVEFNPARVAAYRLIGYENRKLADRDFNDDTKDAGEIGAGHTVTALYEVMLVGQETDLLPPAVDELKYQKQPKASDAAETGELLTVNLRYKQPDADQSTKLAVAVTDDDNDFDQASNDFRFAAAVASFGMLLRGSQYRGESDFGTVLNVADAALGQDRHGYRAEFVEMVKQAARLSGTDISWVPVRGSQHPFSNSTVMPYKTAVAGRWNRPPLDASVLIPIWLGIVLGVGASAIVLVLCLPLLLPKAGSPISNDGTNASRPLKPQIRGRNCPC